MYIPHIAIAEDDPSTADLIALAIGQIGSFRLSRATTAGDLFRLLTRGPLDLILLDLDLPDEHGIAVARQLRARTDVPIIVVTASNGMEMRHGALEVGVDDFITKPFDVKELQLRVRNMLRRTARPGNDGTARSTRPEIAFGNFVLRPGGRYLADSAGEQVPLTKNEYLILSALANANGRTVSRDSLLDAIADGDDAPGTRAVDIYIRNLREKLGDDARTPSLIITVRGMGYRLRR
ncbi:MAG: response regulator transcription factor [Nisaea sp.]|uniref:response regulator transcription factor n=1 Tax=Nisaea sp. TaxID=2024842 RepID=UPI001B124376|nr:response regulator transcription factor [Nisaea sp.]MBO6559275.1 response regulator transcription factor [Nisaea sp.]